MTNSTRQIIIEGTSHFAAGDHQFQTTTRFKNSTWKQQLNKSKDSLQTNPPGIPSILTECFIRNRNSSLHHNGTMSHFNIQRNSNKTEFSDVWTDSRKLRRLPKNNSLDSDSNHRIESSGYVYPTINNMYYQEEVDEGTGDTGRYKSASRPIHRSQQEKDLIRQEEKMISAAEYEYDLATWRMYNRIMKHRQKRPLPDRYYDEVNKVAPVPHDKNNSDSSIPSDLTATTAGTNSTSSSPSWSESPKFAALQHSKSRGRIPTSVNDLDPENWDGEFRGSELPRIIVSDDNADDKNEHLCIIGNDEEEFDDEYTDMMMFDLEL